MPKIRKSENEMENTDINNAENATSVDDATENSAAAIIMTEKPEETNGGEMDESKGADSDEGSEQTSTKPAKDTHEETAGTHGQDLESISSLSSRHRLAGWQTAAILRMKDWEEGIMVSDADFSAAINKLRCRRIGGGRI